MLAIGEAHRRYTRRVNFREGWRGHLWQGRFASFIMDERHLLACARYVERNPVRAGLVSKPQHWQWSIAATHMRGEDDILVTCRPMLRRVSKPWEQFISVDVEGKEVASFRRHERTGRPLGTDSFIQDMETLLKRRLRPQKPGPKPRDK